MADRGKRGGEETDANEGRRRGREEPVRPPTREELTGLPRRMHAMELQHARTLRALNRNRRTLAAHAQTAGEQAKAIAELEGERDALRARILGLEKRLIALEDPEPRREPKDDSEPPKRRPTR